MTLQPDPTVEARADRRVVLVALGVMVALVLSGVAVASLYASTSCRHLRPDPLGAPVRALTGESARALLADAGPGPDGVVDLEAILGALGSAVLLPLDAPLRIGEAPAGAGAAVVTGDGAVLVDLSGDVRAGVTFRRAVTVVGDGVSLFALVVGNTLTGQVDALRPLVPGSEGLQPGTCVDTSAVGSPLSFLHDARGGNLLGLRTDEDGTDAVLELRDHVRGRVWAPVVELPRAPAGLQGSRTSGALGPDTVVVARRVALSTEDPSGAVRAFSRRDGATLWEVDATALRAALPDALADAATLRLEVAHVDAVRALVVVFPDVAADALLPLPTHGPLGDLGLVDPRTVTLALDVREGLLLDVAVGASLVGRDGAERDDVRAALAAAGVAVDDVMTTPQGSWVLVGRVLARLGG